MSAQHAVASRFGGDANHSGSDHENEDVISLRDEEKPNSQHGYFSPGGIESNPLSFLYQIHRHFWRATSTELTLNLISEMESEFLSSKPTSSSSSSSSVHLLSKSSSSSPSIRIQNYMAYRRSTIIGVLYCVLAVAIFRIYNTVQFKQQLAALVPEEDRPEAAVINLAFRIWTVVNYIDIVLLFLGFVFCLFAQHFWFRYQLSQRLFIGAYICILVFPFIMAFIPYSTLVTIPEENIFGGSGSGSMGGSETNADVTLINKLFVGLFLALQFFLTLAPGAFTFALAVLRASLNFRSILPQDPTPGLMARTMALVFTPMVWAIVTIFVQALGSLLAFFSVFLFSWSPLIFFFRRDDLVPPMQHEEAHKKSIKLRYIYIGLNFLAFILLVIYLVGLRQIGKKILSEVFLTTYVLEMLVTWYTDYFCTNLFIADLLVSHCAYSRIRETQIKETNPELLIENEKRKDELVYLKGL
eukprot:TRINITY_DN5794_c0_g1_i1.p1 TRINITY_DN5794_c0_g1~~TRINITY_DN5794_c0_g1_i1.p1  ORF type:complete len:479 (+),score=82.26 TRINITY_DN5794_c0_g1_i1:30-1439(+)